MKIRSKLALAAITFAGSILTASADFVINEIRIDGPAADPDEYIELYTDIENESLDGFAILVIGDGPTGNIEEVITFAPGTTANGHYYLVAQPELQINAVPDQVQGLNFENSDNVTFLLVSGFTGALGDNIDDDGDGVANAVLPWTSIWDALGIVEDASGAPTSTEFEYATGFGFPIIGPSTTATFTTTPAHVYRDGDQGVWAEGTFDPTDPDTKDTPGATNSISFEFGDILFGAGSITESDGAGATTLTISLEEAMAEDVIVNISVADPSEILIQQQATILAGNTSIPVPVNAVDDLWPDGLQTVECTVSALNFFSTTVSINVEDDVTDVAGLTINEVYATGEGDANLDGIGNRANDEFVEIVNTTGGDVDLGGYMIKEFASLSGFVPAQHVFPAGTILPNECAIVVFGGGVVEGRNLDFGGAFVQNRSSSSNGLDLTDSGDIVSLQNPAGVEVAGVNYPNSSGSGSYTRSPDLTGSFSFSFFTPGYQVDGITPFCPLPAALSAEIDNLNPVENGVAATLTVTLPETVGTATTISLTSSDESEAVVPATIEIPADTLFATASVTFPDDSENDGPQTVNINSSAPGYLDAGVTITVEDDGLDGPAGPLQGDLIINEFLFDPASGADVSGDGTASTSNDEFIEFVNVTAGPLDISNWTISDAVGVRHTFAENTIVPAGCAIVVFGGGGEPVGTFGGAQVVVSSSNQLGLNNGGDTITLSDASATVISQVEYSGSVASDESANLDPDLTGTAFAAHSGLSGAIGTWSPGTLVDGTPICEVTGGDYASWAAGYPGIGDKDEDDDLDGLDNLAEYALGKNPLQADATSGLDASYNGSGNLQVSIAKGMDAGSDTLLTWVVEVSTDLINWNTTDTNVLTDNSSSLVVEYTGSSPVIYMRLRVTCP